MCLCIGMILSSISMAIPVAKFSSNITSGCSPIAVQFFDSSTVSGAASWSWNLGNGATSTLQNPSTTYFSSGTYTVQLTVTDATGSNTKTVTNYITVTATPTVNFTGDSSVSCPPKSVAFNNLTSLNSSGTASYIWDFGDGTTSATIAPTHIYNTAGNYSVTLVVTNGVGCTSTLTKSNYIPVVQKPTAAFSGSNLTSCSVPLTASFSNSSSGAATYDWDFGDGGTSTATNPTHTYNTAGAYTVRLIVTNASGCKDTVIKTGYVNITSVHSAFTLSTPSPFCPGTSVPLINNTTPSGATSLWQFGNGNSSTATGPSLSYSTGGTYTLKLYSTYNGCKDSASQTITVSPAPTVQFSANNLTSCSSTLTTQFKNSTTNGNTYLWSFGDGSTSTTSAPSHTYSGYGSYNVKLVATSAAGCKDSVTSNAYIKLQAPTATITADTYGCSPATITFHLNVTNNISPVSSYTWDFGDGSSTVTCSSCAAQSHTYSSTGTYTVTVNYSTGSGCNFTAQASFPVYSKPAASFSVSTDTACPGQPIYLTNTSTNAMSYLWLDGWGRTSTNTNDSFAYRSGTYTIRLVAMNGGCTDTTSHTVTVNLPKAGFTVSYNCASRRTINFTDISIGASAYHWNFGDGSTSTTAGSVSHTYSAYGNYLVKLGIYNSSTGCTDSFFYHLKVTSLVPQFVSSDTTICAGSTVNFIGSPNPNYASCKWDFGDGTTDVALVSAHNYTSAGIYTIKLVVTDSTGCKDSVTKTNYEHVGGATAAFSGSPTGGCVPLPVTFTDQSTPNGGFNIVSRSWNFGDGTTVNNGTSPISHTYNTVGSYNVALTVTDENNCVTTFAKAAYINLTKPTTQFTVSNNTPCLNQSISFANTSTGSGLTYNWSFGDGGTSTSVSPTHSYNAVNDYTVKLVVTDTNGCKDSLIKSTPVHVNAPVVNFTMSDTLANCPPLTVNFTNSSTGAASYNWNMNNGSQSTLSNPSTVYTYPGTYHIKLIGTTAYGCKDSAIRTVTVKGPTGSFSYIPVAGCSPVTISFSATTTNTSSIIWDMNNGYTQTTSTNSFSYTYTQKGNYVPRIILSDNASCLVPIMGHDTIKIDHIDADFSYAPGIFCKTATIQFTDTALSTGTAVASRSWTFGDGGTSNSHNPAHNYTAPGTYTVKLIIGNVQGCLDTIIKTVTINPLPNVTASPNTAICQGQTVPVTLQASGGATYSWSGTGLSCNNCINPSVLPTTTTTYIVTGTDTNGCTDTGVVTVTVNNKPTISAGSNQNICAGSSATLTATGGATYSWSPSTGLSCTGCANPTASPSATTTYKVIGASSNGCSDSASVTVTVNAAPSISAGANKTICAGSSTVLTATGGNTYSWSPSTGLSCNNCANPTATPSTTTIYTVTGTSASGCSSTAQVTVTVNPKPTISAGSNQIVCSGSSTTLTATGAMSYSWSPSTGLSCTGCASPTAAPSSTTTYTVTGIDANACSNTATVMVTVNPKPTVGAGSNQTICSGASATLTGTGATSYIWSPSTGLSCTSCASTTATPSATTTYTVTGTDANGCVNTAAVTVTVNAKPVVSAGSNKTICLGTATQLQASGAATYVWTPASGLSCTSCANPNASPATTTTYSITGTNANGCIDSAKVTVTVNPKPTVSAGPDTAICKGFGTTLTGTGASTYSWSPSTGLSCNNCSNPSVNPATTTTYTITGTDANGCTNTGKVTITVNPIPTITALRNDTICAGDTIQLLASGGSTYIWTPAVSLSCNTCANPVASPLATKTYNVTGTLNGCRDSAKVTITVNPLPVLNAPSKSVCIGDSTTLSVTGAVNYTWSPASGLSCTNCPNPIVNPSATTNYIVTGTDNNGCKASVGVIVTVNPSPKVDAGPDKSLCDGSTVQLSATGAQSYYWSASNTLSCTNCPDPIASPKNDTTYKVVGVDAKGCRDSDDVTIHIIRRQPVSAGNNDTICKGESAQLFAKGGSNYMWYPSAGLNDPSSANPLANPEASTQYNVIIQQGSCFTDTIPVNIIVEDAPTVSLGSDKTVAAGTQITLYAATNENVTYAWNGDGLSCNNCPDPVITPHVNSKYTVTVTNQWGCKAQDDIDVIVSCDQNSLFVANTFTPNGDGVNDKFYPQGKGISEVKSFSVFNRWGQLLYRAENVPLNDPAYGWDGTYKNEPLKPDVFVYILDATCPTGEPVTIKGDISLIK